MSDDTRPYKAGFEAMHERMHGGAAMDTLENAQRRAEYWKAEHIAANAEIERLRFENGRLKEQSEALARTVMGDIGNQREPLTTAQINDLVGKVYANCGHMQPTPEIIVRAIERAHGIGNLPELPTCTKSQTGDVARPPTPIGWSDTDWIKHLQEHQNAAHPLAGLHINQGSMDAAADAYEAEYNAAHNAEVKGDTP